MPSVAVTQFTPHGVVPGECRQTAIPPQSAPQVGRPPNPPVPIGFRNWPLPAIRIENGPELRLPQESADAVVCTMRVMIFPDHTNGVYQEADLRPVCWRMHWPPVAVTQQPPARRLRRLSKIVVLDRRLKWMRICIIR